MNDKQPCALCGIDVLDGWWMCRACWVALPHPMNWVLKDTRDAMTNAIERWENQVQMCREYIEAVQR